MTATDVKIASNALLLLGHEAIASFEETSVGADIASNLYETAYETLLTVYRWRFATKKAVAARLSETPINEFQYMYQMPTDLLYLISTNGGDYEIFEDKIYCNDQTLEIEYIYNISSDKLPAYYVKTLEYYLAAQFAIPITGDLNKADFYGKAYVHQERLARHADSSQRPSDRIRYSPYTDVRN